MWRGPEGLQLICQSLGGRQRRRGTVRRIILTGVIAVTLTCGWYLAPTCTVPRLSHFLMDG